MNFTFISGNWPVYVFNGTKTWSPSLCEKSCHNTSIADTCACNASAPDHGVSYTSQMASINDLEAVCTAKQLNNNMNLSSLN